MAFFPIFGGALRAAATNRKKCFKDFLITVTALIARRINITAAKAVDREFEYIEMKGEDLRHRQHHHRHHHQHHPSIPAVSTEPFRVSPECSQSVSEHPQSAPERPQSVPGISLFRGHVGSMLGSVWG